MATTSFTGNDAGVIYGGRWGADFSNAGIRIRQAIGSHSEVRFVTTGTEARLRIYDQGSFTWRWTVDGGAEQTYAEDGSGNDWITLYTGASDSAHTVIVYRCRYLGYTPDCVEVTGAAPAIAAPTGYTNTQYIIASQSGISEDGSKTESTSEGYPTPRARGSFRFNATTDTIRVWGTGTTGATNDLALVIDKDYANPIRLSFSDDWGWASATGLDGTQEHEYLFSVGRSYYCYSVMLPGGTLNTTALTAYPAVFFSGDSIADATNITNGDSALNWIQQFCIQKNYGWRIAAAAGATAFTHGQANKAVFGATSPQCDIAIYQYGMNDQSGSVSTANFRIAVGAILDQATADEPAKPIYWMGIPKYSAATNRVAYNAETIAEIASRSNPLVVYIDPDGWNGGSNISTGDGTHPNLSGATQIADGLVAAFTSGPPTNTVAPAVTGTEASGKTLSCTTGTWAGADSYAYQWYTNTAASASGGTAITGATSSTFVLTDSQDDLYVYCVVTATNEEGSDSEPSNVVGPILGLNVVVKNNPVFADVAEFDQETIFNEAIGDDGTGEEMPAPTTWNTDSPVGDIDWSAFTLAVDANAINRSNRAGATLISPNYCVIAQHAPGDNTGHTWMTPAGAEVTRTLGETLDVDYWEFSGSDLALCKLSAPINNITPMPMILDSSKLAGRGCLVLEMDRHLNAYVIPSDLDNSDASVSVYQDPGTDYIESGDSGKPVTIIIDDTAVMVMTAMFASSIDGSRYIGLGPNASHFIDEIFAITAEDGESPTVWDLQLSSGGRASSNATSLASAFSSANFPYYF